MEGVTLLTKLKELDGDQLIKLGAKNGSAFCYIGTADELLRSMKAVDEVFRACIEGAVASSKKYLKGQLANAPTLASYATEHHKTHLNGKMRLSMDGYDNYVAQWFKSVTTAFIRVDTWQDRLDKYKPINRRRVIETYNSVEYDEPSLIILIEGYEVGKLWMPSEVKNGTEEETDEG